MYLFHNPLQNRYSVPNGLRLHNFSHISLILHWLSFLFVFRLSVSGLDSAVQTGCLSTCMCVFSARSPSAAVSVARSECSSATRSFSRCSRRRSVTRTCASRRQTPASCHSAVSLTAVDDLLWSPYGIGQTIIFLPCGFYLSSFFFFFLT